MSRSNIEGRVDYEDPRERASRSELADRIAKRFREDGNLEPIEGLRLSRLSQPSDRIYAISKLALCVIAQGVKEIHLGDKRYLYDAQHYLLVTAELPVVGRIIEASRERPYLSLSLELDPALVGSVMVEIGLPAPQVQKGTKALVVSPINSGLLDATLRLMRLIDSPAEAKFLGPLIRREIIFRLLLGEQGNLLRHLPSLGAHTHRIAQAVDLLRKDFDRPLRIDHLAKELGMSPSGFHHHFKAMTEMSPLQYQKQLRLQEARQLMLGKNLDAASAGFRVGYEDPSHFSRDYKKHFGNSPIRDIEKLRSTVIAE